MIHLALMIASVLFLGMIALLGLSILARLVWEGFEQHWGCGCLAMVVSAGIVLLVIGGLYMYFS